MRVLQYLITIFMTCGFFMNSSIFEVHAQSKEIRLLPTQKKIKVIVYRGIIKVTSTTGSVVCISSELSDYDLFEKTGEVKRIKNENGQNIEIQSDASVYTFINETCNQLFNIRLAVPQDINLDIQVIHFGQIEVDGIKGEIQAKVFNGAINVQRAENSVSSAVLRKGSIVIQGQPKPATLIAASVFDGNITLDLPSHLVGKVRVKSEMGQIRNDSGATLIPVDSYAVESKTATGRITKIVSWMEGYVHKNIPTNIIAHNTFGTITLKLK